MSAPLLQGPARIATKEDLRSLGIPDIPGMGVAIGEGAIGIDLSSRVACDPLSMLAERTAAATCPDRELDALIRVQVALPDFPSATMIEWNGIFFPCVPSNDAEGKVGASRFSIIFDHPPYTGSMDVAAQLVPEGWSFEVRRSGTGDEGQATIWNPMCVPGHPSEVRVTGCASPALALCAAALRVRAALPAGDAT